MHICGYIWAPRATRIYNTCIPFYAASKYGNICIQYMHMHICIQYMHMQIYTCGYYSWLHRILFLHYSIFNSVMLLYKQYIYWHTLLFVLIIFPCFYLPYSRISVQHISVFIFIVFPSFYSPYSRVPIYSSRAPMYHVLVFLFIALACSFIIPSCFYISCSSVPIYIVFASLYLSYSRIHIYHILLFGLSFSSVSIYHTLVLSYSRVPIYHILLFLFIIFSCSYLPYSTVLFIVLCFRVFRGSEHLTILIFISSIFLNIL